MLLFVKNRTKRLNLSIILENGISITNLDLGWSRNEVTLKKYYIFQKAVHIFKKVSKNMLRMVYIKA